MIFISTLQVSWNSTFSPLDFGLPAGLRQMQKIRIWKCPERNLDLVFQVPLLELFDRTIHEDQIASCLAMSTNLILQDLRSFLQHRLEWFSRANEGNSSIVQKRKSSRQNCPASLFCLDLCWPNYHTVSFLLNWFTFPDAVLCPILMFTGMDWWILELCGRPWDDSAEQQTGRKGWRNQLPTATFSGFLWFEASLNNPIETELANHIMGL